HQLANSLGHVLRIGTMNVVFANEHLGVERFIYALDDVLRDHVSVVRRDDPNQAKSRVLEETLRIRVLKSGAAEAKLDPHEAGQSLEDLEHRPGEPAMPRCRRDRPEPAGERARANVPLERHERSGTVRGLREEAVNVTLERRIQKLHMLAVERLLEVIALHSH